MIRLLCAPLAIYLAGESRLPPWLLAASLALAACALRWPTRRAPWALLCAIMVADLLYTPTLVANHAFVLTYLCALAASAPGDEDTEMRAAAARGLFIVIMGMATLQKALSPRFISGEYFYYMAAQGRLGAPPLLELVPTVDHALALREAAVEQWREDYPGQPLDLMWGRGMARAARALSWAALLAEGALTASAAYTRRARGMTVFYAAMLAFLPALIALRTELVFAATLATMVLWMDDGAAPRGLKRAMGALWAALTAGAAVGALP